MSYHPVHGIRSQASNLILRRPYTSSLGIVREPYREVPCLTAGISSGRYFNGLNTETEAIARAGDALDGSSDDNLGTPMGRAEVGACLYTLGPQCGNLPSTCTNGCFQCHNGVGPVDDIYSYNYCEGSTDGAWVNGQCPGDSTLACPEVKIE
jgi:hypothetical protein